MGEMSTKDEQVHRAQSVDELIPFNKLEEVVDQFSIRVTIVCVKL